MYQVNTASYRIQLRVRYLGAGFSGICKLPDVGAGALFPLEEQQVLLTCWPSLQPLNRIVSVAVKYQVEKAECRQCHLNTPLVG